MTATTNDREYTYCPACDNYMYRIPGHLHGDGQLDTDDAPVWLLTDEDSVIAAGLDTATLANVNCGCND